MFTVRHRDDSEVLALPGREWGMLLGPEVCSTNSFTLGFARFPAGSAPAGHVHAHEEEAIFVISGSGFLRGTDEDDVVRLEPGTAVLISPGTYHATEADDSGDLHLLTLFTPPVVPGSYERL